MKKLKVPFLEIFLNSKLFSIFIFVFKIDVTIKKLLHRMLLDYKIRCHPFTLYLYWEKIKNCYMYQYFLSIICLSLSHFSLLESGRNWKKIWNASGREDEIRDITINIRKIWNSIMLDSCR